jgi:hypothetical protein
MERVQGDALYDAFGSKSAGRVRRVLRPGIDRWRGAGAGGYREHHRNGDRDETGGALPGATVTVTGLANGATRTTVTSEAGRYQVAGLQPAGYSVKVDLQGFATVVRSSVTNLGSRTPTFERNAFRAPGFNQVDLRFTYKVPSSHGNIALYVEGFNLFNRVNVQSVNNHYGPTPGQPLAAWRLPTAYYPPRQMQLGMHIGF